MTVGEQIAQKRKELGLSQESLGEQLGVSRQAIYKWESDTTLPEIEKLIALSRIFSVSVGWLLGVEEQLPAARRDDGGELTEIQVKMIEEIVNRYLAARNEAEGETPPNGQGWPKPEAVGFSPEELRLIQEIVDRTQAAQPEMQMPKRRKWPFVLAGLVLAVVFVSLFSRLSELKQQYTNLQNSIYNVTTNVNRDISSITQRVEDVLKSQNELTAVYSSQVVSADLAANTVTFSVHATPKTYTEGMDALFVADNGNTLVRADGVLAVWGSQEFSAEITCELTDTIALSVVFVTGDKRETQFLDSYDGLYSSSFPFVHLTWPLWFSVDRDTLEPNEQDLLSHNVDPGKDFGGDQQAEVASLRVGLFKDRKLVTWYEETVRVHLVDGKEQMRTVYVREEEVALERGHIYCEAVVVVDQFGRERVYMDTPIEFKESEGEWGQVSSYDSTSSPEGWEY